MLDTHTVLLLHDMVEHNIKHNIPDQKKGEIFFPVCFMQLLPCMKSKDITQHNSICFPITLMEDKYRNSLQNIKKYNLPVQEKSAITFA